ncbi:MAG: hypothetical protein ACON45_07205 [Paracoccaceae bacterium]
MKVGIIAGLVALSMSTTVYAETEGRRLATLAFKSVDENQDGYASLEEQMRQAENFFVSMDVDDNGILSWQEFSTWGFGMEDAAQESGREQAYETARKVVFDLWNRSDDWKLTEEEQRRGITADFFQADEDRDGRLSKMEMLKHSIINVTLRSALRLDQ